MIEKAILKINPNASFSVNADDINQITWHNGTTPIAIEDIQTKIIELENEYTADEYKRNRAVEYKSLTEQLDMQYWDAVNGTTNWQDHINAIKTKYPKPE